MMKDYDSKPSFGSRYGSRSSKQPRQEYENSTSELEGNRVDENFNAEISMVSSEPFHGFLTIGTLGTEPIISEPATPTFPMSAENITEEKTEVTEHDLKLINDELEKFLEAEAEEEENIESSGRNSYVSIITLSDKPMEGTNFEDHGKMMVCPLQGYLFGSIEFPETITEEKKEKASLGELFHRTKTTDETSLERNGKGVMPAKQMHKSVKNLMTKMLKKFHASPKNRMPSYSDTASVSTKKKLHKVIQMFHRKIHPENSIAEKELKTRNNKFSSNPYGGGHVEGGLDKDNRSCLPGSKSKDQIQYKTSIKLPQYGLRGSASSGNREHWIKTDADYLVLEL
ncbi:Protein LAZY 1 [Melia azedarach]|uniref:Protein LAZY 1 n=1 Tax=Melia azedarach TaxID=155640 RepID=A0ACC1Z1J4_MELAZ|nr:Protein LAZY 1 [Melia azedarach]